MKNNGRPRSRSAVADSPILLMIAVSMLSFFFGTIFSAHMNMECISGSARENSSHHFMNAKVEELAQRRVAELQALSASKEQKSSLVKFPDTTQNFAQGLARTSKTDFFSHFDLGVPMDLPTAKDSDVLLLYNREKAFPDTYKNPSMLTDSSSIPEVAMDDAVKNCDYLHVILANHGRNKNQCTAIVPNYESYHIQKWMRLGGKGLDTSKGFSLVSRGIETNGRQNFKPPKTKHIQRHWDILKNYFDSYQATVDELKPLVENAATAKKTVTVMVSNFGQSELLMNFVCAAKSRSLDISSIIVFATDTETKELAEGLGLKAFYDKRNYGEIPAEAANVYGDKKFTAMMMAKVMCVQMINSLGYNVLFQDVDIVWYKNPIPFFEADNPDLDDFDMLFQEDGGHSVRYAPYSANSGFYYVRYNPKTAYFFSNLLMSSDMILESGSHQQVLIALLSEHVSLFGLKVKIFSKDTDEFPGGFHFHQKSRKYMKRLVKGEVSPYIFHMSWTKNKDNKLLFLEQLGEWYVNNDQCLHKKPEELSATDNTLISECCLDKPVVKCHYVDKPSKFPCFDSPPIDKGGRSFWNPKEFKPSLSHK